MECGWRLECACPRGFIEYSSGGRIKSYHDAAIGNPGTKPVIHARHPLSDRARPPDYKSIGSVKFLNSQNIESFFYIFFDFWIVEINPKIIENSWFTHDVTKSGK
jgi:hypothetical protein